KERTFFFVSWEGLRQSRGLTAQASVPSDAFKAAVHAASPALDPIMNVFPHGQAATPDPNVDTFTHLAHATVSEDSWLVRVDHKFSGKTNLYFRATRDIAFADTPEGNLFDRNAIQSNPANLVLALQHAFSPTLFNEAKFGINRAPFRNPSIGIVPVTYVIPGQGTATGITFDSSGIFETLNDNVTDVEVGTTLGYIDNLTWTRGRHTFKTGIEVRRIDLNQGKTADTTISYTTAPSIIANTAEGINVQGPWCCHGLRRTFVLPYFQDEFKFRPNLTFNAGLRWEYYSVITEAQGRGIVFDLARCGGICPHGTPAYFPNYRNFDPRVSLAWSPARFHGNTVIRTGFGIYHGAAQNDDENQPLESDAFRTRINSGATFPIDPLLASAKFSLRTPRAIQRDRRDLYVEQWGLSIQQALPGNLLLTTAYSGSHGVRLFARNFENTCANLIVNNGNCVRPLDPFTPPGQTPIGLVDIKSDTGTSSYHALLLTLQRNFRNGLLFQANYSYAHSVNDGSVGGGESNAVQNA
ncbi:MAG TPA: TonB-dependent receptor, partial [Candidatus Acidoferrales bacterium]|nr:TonB-dependent receptor [Candidatus Acidoferrales bacterium]